MELSEAESIALLAMWDAKEDLGELATIEDARKVFDSNSERFLDRVQYLSVEWLVICDKSGFYTLSKDARKILKRNGVRV